MQRMLEDRIALVTGGGSGIGRATALIMAREGAAVIVAGRGTQDGEETVRAIRGAGGEARFIKTDVTRASDVEALIRNVVDVYGRIDCAFNNAGVEGMLAPLADQTEEAFDHVMTTNLKGVWLCMKYEIDQMLRQGGGRGGGHGGVIVNVSAVAGLAGSPRASVYAASKHGVIGLTRSAALEYAKSEIRVNAICPGVVRTPQWARVLRVVREKPDEAEAWWAGRIPRGRVGRPEEIGEAVVWLCSDAASYVTGHALVVDGGFSAQ